MTKEDLIKLKQDIAALSEEDIKERDLYLRGLANGDIQGPPVGYPSIDKPWLKYYSEEQLGAEYHGKTFYQFLRTNNENNMDSIALKYFNLEISYREMFKKIDECARALVGIGIKKGDTVGICAPTTPETVYLLYAINKIGAVANLIDIRKKSEDIEYCLNLHDNSINPVKALFVYDGQVDRIQSFINKTKVESLISISPLDSLPTPIRFAYNPKLYFKSISKNKIFYNFDEFISKGKDIKDIQEENYSADKVSFIEYTSGSTGKPKAVALNDSTGNHRVFQYMNNGMEYSTGDTYLNIIPIFLAFGAFIGIHLPLSMGMTDELIPSFDSKKIYSYFNKSKAKHMTLTPASYTEFVHDSKYKKMTPRDKKKLSLDKLQTLGCGGDGFNANAEEQVNKKLWEKGCKVPLNNGYGCSEIGAPFSTQRNDVFKFGSVGIPLPGNNISILEHNTLNEVPYGVIGDICMIVDYPMLKYINNKELTKNVMLQLPDGRIGVRLEDAGYVDKDGHLFVKGRYDNAIIKNEKTIWPVDIENIIMSSNLVKMCSVVPINNTDFDCRVFIVPNDQYNDEQMQQFISRVMKEFQLSYDFVITKELALTSSGKIDREKLKVYTK